MSHMDGEKKKKKRTRRPRRSYEDNIKIGLTVIRYRGVN